MIFVHGYVHCDPHPGNVLVNKTLQGKTEIVLLDHGLYQVNNNFTGNEILAGYVVVFMGG